MSSKRKDKPNVIFVLADDMANWALGCYGNNEIRTPHLDALANDGIRFNNFFCTSPVCSPARASLLTGKMPSQHGVQDWIRSGIGDKGDPLEYLEGHQAYTEILAEQGYICGIIGKWHLGYNQKVQKGFSHWFVIHSDGGGYNDVPMIRNGELVQTQGYLSDIITDDAIQFLEQQSTHDQPFYLSVNYYAPHSPWVDQHPQHLVDSYEDCLFESCPQETRHKWIDHHPIQIHNSEIFASPDRKKIAVREHLKGYFAAVTAMDECIGRIRNKLKELSMEENTLIIFMSDNGFNCGHHGIWGKGNATFPQNMYDNSVKVPCIMAHPNRIQPGQVSEHLLSGYDFMPTLLEYVGLAPSDQLGLPGRSFADLLEGKSLDEQHAVVVYDEYGPVRMIRTHEWKYVHRYPYGPHELYNLVHDPGEKVNLLVDERVWDEGEADREQVVAELKLELEEWFENYTDVQIDGRLQANTGRGQHYLVGPKGRGKKVFNELETRKIL